MVGVTSPSFDALGGCVAVESDDSDPDCNPTPRKRVPGPFDDDDYDFLPGPFNSKLPSKMTAKGNLHKTQSGFQKKRCLPLGRGMRHLLRTFPGDLSRQIIVGMGCPCYDDPPKPRGTLHLGGECDLDVGDSLRTYIGLVKMSRNIWKRMRRQQRNLACLTGNVLLLHDYPL